MNDIKNDTNLREAVNRREQHLPTMPADLNERLMQRLQERRIDDGTSELSVTAPQSRIRHIRLYAAVAASILLIICIGTVILTDKPTDYPLYTSQQMETQQNPEGVIRLQAGVTPLQKRTVTIAPKGRQSSLPPLWGLTTPCLFTGVSPLPMVLMPLRGYPSKMCIKTPSFGGRQKGAGGKATGRRVSGNVVARSSVKHELPDTLGDGVWQSERNVVRAMQMLGECETVIEKSEQKVRNNIVRCTYNATPQPANAVLVTNEAGDYEVIETKNIIEI